MRKLKPTELERTLREKFEKLGNLEEIEARLARQERQIRILLIVIIILCASAFTVWLGHILEPAWLPFDD